MPGLISIEQLVEQAKTKTGAAAPVMPSTGIPSKNNNNSSLTAWTVLEIYPLGAPRPNNRSFTTGTGNAAPSTWVLPLPQELSEVHSLNFESTEMGFIEQLAGAAMSGTVVQGGGGVFDAIISAAGAVAAGAAGVVGATAIEQLIKSGTRFATNPAMESLFKSANLRNYNFSWNLIPLNSSDSVNIDSFKKEMLKNIYPAIGGLSGISKLIFPAEVMFTFQARGNSSQDYTIFKTQACGVTEFTVSYGVQGSYGAHEDGYPSGVTINMTAQELFTPVQQDF